MSETITETVVAVEPTLHMKLDNGIGPHPPTKSKNNNSTMRTRNLRLDPSRALEPARKKLSTIESQRIMAVVEETIKRVEIVTSLPFIMGNIERFRVSLGSELYEVLKQHFQIQESYKDIRENLDVFLERRAKAIAKKESLLAQEEAAAEESENEEEESEFDPDEDYENEKETEAHLEEGADEVDDKPEEQEGELKENGEQAETAEDRNESASRAASNVERMMSQESILADLEPRIEETMRTLGLVAQQVSHSCKNILRLFTVNPAAMKLLNNEERLRSEGGQNILRSLNTLRDILMHKLLTTPEEEVERMSYLDEISKRERHNAAIIERQEHDLKEAIDDKEEEISKKNDVIKRLQYDLHQIEKFSDENIRRLRAEAEKQEIADSKNSDQKTQKLQAEINQLQTQLNNAIAEHREHEADLRGKKFKVETEVDRWIQKYDEDLGQRQDEYEEIDLVYTEEKKQLLELEERFATLEKEYMAIMEERRQSRDKRERAQRELALLVKSATTIQAFWRSYKVRKALKAKSKKKGKGKGKK